MQSQVSANRAHCHCASPALTCLTGAGQCTYGLHVLLMRFVWASTGHFFRWVTIAGPALPTTGMTLA